MSTIDEKLALIEAVIEHMETEWPYPENISVMREIQEDLWILDDLRDDA